MASLKQRLNDEQMTSRKLEEKIHEMKSASSEQDKVRETLTDVSFHSSKPAFSKKCNDISEMINLILTKARLKHMLCVPKAKQ